MENTYFSEKETFVRYLCDKYNITDDVILKERPDYKTMNDYRKRCLVYEQIGRAVVAEKHIYKKLFGEDANVVYVTDFNTQVKGVDTIIEKEGVDGQVYVDEKCLIGNGDYNSSITLELEQKGKDGVWRPTFTDEKMTTALLYISFCLDTGKIHISLWMYEALKNMAEELRKEKKDLERRISDDMEGFNSFSLKMQLKNKFHTSNSGEGCYVKVPLTEAYSHLEFDITE